MGFFQSLGNPKFPSFSSARELEFDLSGVKFKIVAPQFSARRGQEEKFSLSHNIYQVDKYIAHDDGSLPFFDCFNTRWCVKGFPVVHGIIGEINFGFSVLSLPGSPKIFDSNFFENSIIEAHRSTYKESPGLGDYTAFIDSHVSKINDTQWFVFSAKRDGHLDYNGSRFKHFYTPIDDGYAIAASMSFDLYRGFSNLTKVFDSFCDDFMGNVVLKFPEVRENIPYSLDPIKINPEVYPKIQGPSII